MNMGLNEYQASALTYLLLLGETKATTLSRSSGLPSARIYGVLDELAKMGLITIRPGRPMLYKARLPEDIAGVLVSLNMNELKEKLKTLEGYAGEFIEMGNRIYLKGEKGVSIVPLLRIVSVDDVSIEETKQLYDAAKGEILILSRAMEYLGRVSENLVKALKRGVSVRIILMRSDLLERESKEKQKVTLEKMRDGILSKVELHFTDNLPIRGCMIDPEDRGKALFLVEDPGVPFFLREAAITSHPSVVKGLALMFNLIWKYNSFPYQKVAEP